MQTNLPVIIPVSIIENEPPIDAVQMPDGRQGATLRSLCALLDIDKGRQVARIKRNPSLAAALVLIEVSTPGGPQQADVLVAWAIPVWAAGLHISRLSEAKRSAALVLQRKAFAAIEQAFSERENNASHPEAPAPQAPAPELPPGSLRQIRQGLLLAVEGITRFEAEHQALVEQVNSLERGPARPTVGLSPQRLERLLLLAHELRQRKGLLIDETFVALAGHFQVENIFYLPEKDWPAILLWFESMLEE
jgi:hypothetical protein